jgi:surface protein
MFSGCNAFNGNIGNWDVTTVTNMDNMFFNSLTFNNGGSPSINNWNVSNVTSMSQGFRNAQAFNQPIGIWDMSKVTTIWTMMQQTLSFDQDLNSWNTGNVTVMHGVFAASKFNRNISTWNTSKATTIAYMFSKEWYQGYNHPVGDWDISSLTNASVFMNTGSFSTANYDDLLVKWATKPKKNNVSLYVTAKYSPSSAASRSILINTHGWTITDNGQL